MKVSKLRSFFNGIGVRVNAVVSSKAKDRGESGQAVSEYARKPERIDFTLPNHDHEAVSSDAVNIELNVNASIARYRSLCERVQAIRDRLPKPDKCFDGLIAKNVDCRHTLVN